jgi:chromosome partitioning protein
MEMSKVLILNAKGGCGKTTIATNLAACWASKGLYPALLDYDTQGTALTWLNQRPKKHPQIHGVEAFKHNIAMTRSYQMRMPSGVDRIVIDTPAAISGTKITEYIRQANTIIIPVLPSPIDVHSVTSFIKEIIMLGKMRSAMNGTASQHRGTRLAVVANRVTENTRVYKTLESFLSGVNIPMVAALQDSQYYIHSFMEGVGVHELEDQRTQFIQRQWQPLLDWIDHKSERYTGVSGSDLKQNFLSG